MCRLLPWTVASRALGILIVLIGFTWFAVAQEPLPLSRGQTVYVPVYSEIPHGDLGRKGKPATQLLSALVSVRNTDPGNALRVTSARYYDSNGRLLKDFVPSARKKPGSEKGPNKTNKTIAKARRKSMLLGLPQTKNSVIAKPAAREKAL